MVEAQVPFFTFNVADCRRSRQRTADDVKFVAMLLDDLATVANVDPKRVFATGISNGGMMSYRLRQSFPTGSLP